jgi:uncharacterized protein
LAALRRDAAFAGSMMGVIDSDATAIEPFHAGEQALQARAGVRERMAQAGPRVIRDHMPEPHRELFGKLPFVLIGSVDDSGQPQASLLAGVPGFMRTPDAQTLTIHARPDAADPLHDALRVGATLGALGIEPHTRRRNRMNGVVEAVHAWGFSVHVQQSFGNCPKYIQARQASWLGRDDAPVSATHSAQLDAHMAAIVRHADTFFIATSVPQRELGASAAHGVDVSHRGGKPGFVRVERGADGVDTLTVPDFAGNNLFNTLGNLRANPRAGLLFVDFQRGDRLHLAVSAQIEWEGAELAAFPGALRLLRLRVREALHLSGAPSLAWSGAELSPFLQSTGTWADVGAET